MHETRDSRLGRCGLGLKASRILGGLGTLTRGGFALIPCLVVVAIGPSTSSGCDPETLGRWDDRRTFRPPRRFPRFHACLPFTVSLCELPIVSARYCPTRDLTPAILPGLVWCGCDLCAFSLQHRLDIAQLEGDYLRNTAPAADSGGFCRDHIPTRGSLPTTADYA